MNDRVPYTDELLTTKRTAGDLPADAFTYAIFKDDVQKIELRNWLGNLKSNMQLAQLPDAYAGYQFIKESNCLPAWADVKLMKAGSALFARHAQVIMNLLGLLSLPYCYTAANGAMVLYLSERMKTDVGKRLIETAGFVWDVMSPGAFEKEGSGFSSILKIRLMHAAARFYILKSGKWDNAWGAPVNQEDMAGTNLSFSLLIVRGLRKFGFVVSYQGQQAFMHLWNVIGFLLGLNDDLLPANGKQAFNLEQAIKQRQFKKSTHGVALTQALTAYFISINAGGQFSNSEVYQVMRYLLGNDVADMLELPIEQLPVNKIRLLKAVNYISTFQFNESTGITYANELHKFKQNAPVFY